MKKIIVLDIDGTIYNTKGKIPAKTDEALQILKTKKIEIIIATGRSPDDFQDLLEKYQITSYIAHNGGIVINKGKKIYDTPFSMEKIQKFQKKLKTFQSPVIYHQAEKKVALKKDENIIKKFLKESGWKENGIQFQDKLEPVYLIQCLNPTQTQKELIQKMRNIKKYPWKTGKGIELIPDKNSKGNGIGRIIQSRKLEDYQIIAFGDGDNDIEMIQKAEIGVVMGNATQKLKEKADIITKSVDEDGLYQGLHQLDLV